MRQDIIYHESGAYALPTDIESTLINIPGVKDAGVTSIPTYAVHVSFPIPDLQVP